MQRLKLDSVLILIFILCCFQSRSQDVINTVAIEKINAGLFKIQYKLNSTTDYDIDKVVLKILRRRGGGIEEIFSRDITSGNTRIPNQQVYNYNWKPENGLIKTGDELQAKIVLTYKASLAKQKTKLPNKAPHADAGGFLEVELPVHKPIILNGSKSHDEDGKIVSAQWKQISGPTNLTILNKDLLMYIIFATDKNTISSTTCMSVYGEFKEGSYAFELLIKDDQNATAVSRTVLKVKSAPIVINTIPVNPAPKKDSAVVRKVVPVLEKTVETKTTTKLKGGPSNAALNVLLPGVGHYFVSGNHNGENRKATSFILTGIYATSIGGAFYFSEKSNNQYKKYNELADYREYQKDVNGVVIGVRGGSEEEANQYLNSAKSAHRNSLICLGVGGGVLVGDLIYTFMKGSKNKREWKNASTSFRPNLFISSNGSGTTAGVQFKF